MNAPHRAGRLLAAVCGVLLVTAGCATSGAGPAPRVRSGSQNTADGPTRDQCTKELPVLEARLPVLYRERVRIREKLTNAGFERTTAEAIGDGTAAPGLVLEAARSADALEKLLADRPAAHPDLGKEVDWIAMNWFDPTLMRWTSAQIRSLTSLTTDQFRDLKAETLGLRVMLPNITATRRRVEELKGCQRRGSRTDESPLATPDSAAAPERTPPSTITCGPDAARVRCQEAVTVEARGAVSALQPLDSASMTSDELRMLGPGPSAWMAFVRNAAGAGVGTERVYVDGMPVVGDVPAAVIGRITVNGDPFSSEYSNVGEIRVDIDSIVPERRWHTSLSSPSFGIGGGSPLGETGQNVSRYTAMGVSGPVPRLPLTFSVQATRSLDSRRPLFVSADSPAMTLADDTLRSTSSSSGLVVSAALATGRVIAIATFSEGRIRSDHAGIGVVNGPTTGQRLDSRNRAVQATWRIADGRRIHRGGLSFRQDRLSAEADSHLPLSMITGQIVTGGDEVALSARRSQSWMVKHVVDMDAGKWKAGVEVGSELVRDEREPNPLGRLQFNSVDAATATWIVSKGRTAASVRVTSLAMFAEQLTMNSPRMTLRSGLRIDWQSNAGPMVSPRVAAAVRFSGVQLTGGAGLFVQTWSPELFVVATERDGTRGATFVVHDVDPGTLDQIDPTGGEGLRTQLARDMKRRRDFVVRAGIQRRLGPLQTGVEHTWTRGASLPGAVRVRDAGGLIDHINSDRALRRHQTHVRTSARAGRSSITAYYQQAWSFDDSDGPMVAPARQDDVRGEWARSAGVARHAVGVTGLLGLPRQIRMALALEARSGVPYNVITGFDSDGLATFTDRGGRPRNSGTLPSFRKVSLSASRTIRVPSVPWLAVDVGLRVDNVTNRRNVLSLGRVVGTPAFGMPLDAAAGRSVRLWASLAR